MLNLTKYLQLRFYGWVARTLKNLIARRYLWSIGGHNLMAQKMRKRINS